MTVIKIEDSSSHSRSGAFAAPCGEKLSAGNMRAAEPFLSGTDPIPPLDLLDTKVVMKQALAKMHKN